MSKNRAGGIQLFDFKELGLFLLLAAVTILTGAQVVQTLAEAFAEPPRGVSYHLFFMAGSLIGLSPDGTVVFAATFLLGLFTLLLLDEYRRYVGAFLLLVSLVGVGILSESGLVLVPWGDYLSRAVLGFVAGLVLGGTNVRQWSLRHDLLDTTGTNSRLEFPTAIQWVYVLVILLVLVSITEGMFVYESPLLYRGDSVYIRGLEFVALDNSGLLIDIVSAVLFLFCVGVYRNVTSDKNVTLLGASATGKTATMAGLGKAVDSYADGTFSLNAPLKDLRNELNERKRTGGTLPERALPLEMTFKHGRLLPRKVTVRVLDYAGTHIQEFTPIDESETVTPDIETAAAVARHIYNDSISLSDDKLTTRDEGKDPEKVPGLRGESDADQIVKLLQDVVFYSDGVGLLFPMDDYAEDAVRAGLEPPYVSVDRSKDGFVDSAREHDPYVGTMRQVSHEYEEEGDKNVFVVATKADIVREWCESVQDVDPEDDWEAFGDTIADECIGTKMPSEVDDVVPVHFEVADEEHKPGEEVTLDTTAPDGKYALRGAGRLLDQMGDTQLRDLLPGGKR